MVTPTMVDKSYAAAATAPKQVTKSVAINTELTWPVDNSKYKKLSDIKKGKKNKIKEQLRTKRKQQLGNFKRCPWILKIHKIGRALVSLRQGRTPKKRMSVQTDLKRLNNTSQLAIVIKH